MSREAILTTCMGRVDFLKQALPTWLALTNFPVFIVAYECAETERFVYELGESRVWLRCMDAADHDAYGRPLFNKCRALNEGLRMLSDAHLERVLLLDADTLLKRPIELISNHRTFQIVLPKDSTRDLTGVLSADVHMLQSAGGANEQMSGYGGEDLDLRVRLYLRGADSVSWFPSGTFEAIPHNNELRSRHYAEKDLMKSAAHNMEFFKRSLSGRELMRLATDPIMPTLLGSMLAP